MTNTTHTNCTHPATKAGRAACRKARAAGTTITMPTAAVAKAATIPTHDAGPYRDPSSGEALIASIKFEDEPCGRCSGTGTYPSSAYQGVCLGCSGSKTKLTRAGRAAYKKYEAYLAANHTKMMIELQPGDDIRKLGRYVRVHDVDTTLRNHGGHATIGSGENAVSFCTIFMTYTTHMADGTDCVNSVGPYSHVIVRPRGEAQQLAFRHVAAMKGAILTYA